MDDDKQELKPDIPLSICLRCGKEYDEPIPEVTHPEGDREIASVHYCARCNTLIMTVLFRNNSAYRRVDLGGSNVSRRQDAS